ncbi:MAG: hypothetical protein U5L45_05175 [Saprospiraceae bacterium]|nr:hypothetical protein [Saprospiraceae bacterium]
MANYYTRGGRNLKAVFALYARFARVKEGNLVRFSAKPKNEPCPSLARAKRARDAKAAFRLCPPLNYYTLFISYFFCSLRSQKREKSGSFFGLCPKNEPLLSFASEASKVYGSLKKWFVFRAKPEKRTTFPSFASEASKVYGSFKMNHFSSLRAGEASAG